MRKSWMSGASGVKEIRGHNPKDDPKKLKIAPAVFGFGQKIIIILARLHLSTRR